MLQRSAPFRKDNLLDDQVRGPEIPAGPGRSPEIPLALGTGTSCPKRMIQTTPRREGTTIKT